tara:strand:+ start:4730 stop:6322 length:1593 start_codon:yes stop_codon:yes gene_type:complete
MDEEQGLQSPIAGGIRGIRRSVSSGIFTGRAVPPPVQPDPQTTSLLSQNSLSLSSVSGQLSAISDQILSLNSSLSVIKSNLDVSDQLDRQREAAKQKREAILAEQGLREGKESELERKIQTALLAPVRRVAGFAQGILSRLGNFLFILAAGWLTDKTLSFLRLTSEGNVDKLNEFKRKFLFDLAILGGVGLALTVGIGKLVGVVGAISGLALKFAFSALLAAPFVGALKFIKNNVDNFRKNFGLYIRNLVTKGPGKVVKNLGLPLLGLGAIPALFPKQIKNFFKSVFGKKLVAEAAEGVAKTGAKTGLKGSLKTLGPLGIGLEAALTPLFAYFDFKDRKKEGQTDKQAKVGATATAAGGLVGTLIGLTLIPEPLTSAAGIIGLTLLSMFGGGGAGFLADRFTGANKKKKKEEETYTVEGVEGRADGGPVDAKKPYVVGEKGPELFSSDVSGMITPINFKKDSKVSDLIASFDQSAEITTIPLSPSGTSLPASATMATSSKTPSDSIPNIPSSDFANNFIGYSESVYNVVV